MEGSEEAHLRAAWAEEARAEADARRAAREAALAAARARGDFLGKGRPVTWIGGGGQDPSALSRMGVPALRELFRTVFGQARSPRSPLIPASASRQRHASSPGHRVKQLRVAS